MNNKLDVSGGVLSRFALGPDRAARFVLVILTRDDGEDGDRQVDVKIVPPTLDEPLRTSFEAPEAAVGEFPGFAFFDIAVTLPFDGRWVVEVTGGGETLSLPLAVSSWETQPPPAFG